MEILQDLSVELSYMVKKHLKHIKQLDGKTQKELGKLIGNFKDGLDDMSKNESVSEAESLTEMSSTLEKMIYFAMGVFRLPRMNRVLYKWVTDPNARKGSIKLSDEDIKMMFDEFNIKLPKNAFKD